MPKTAIVLYREEDGTVPFMDWYDRIPERAQDKCTIALERLAERGHELRRPESDLLQNGLHELRIRIGRVHYRVLYFFAGQNSAVVVHGVTKEQRLSPGDLARAARRKRRFEANPNCHTHRGVVR